MNKYILLALIVVAFSAPTFAKPINSNATGETEIGVAIFQISKTATTKEIKEQVAFARLTGHTGYHSHLGLGGEILLLSGKKEKSTSNGLLSKDEDSYGRIGELYVDYSNEKKRSSNSALVAYAKGGAFYSDNPLLVSDSAITLFPTSVVGGEVNISSNNSSYGLALNLTRISRYIPHNDNETYNLKTTNGDEISSVFAIEIQGNKKVGDHTWSFDINRVVSEDYISIQTLSAGWNYDIVNISIGRLSSAAEGSLFKKAHADTSNTAVANYISGSVEVHNFSLGTSYSVTGDNTVITNAYVDPARDAITFVNANERALEWSVGYDWNDIIPHLKTGVYGIEGKDIKTATVGNGSESEYGFEVEYKVQDNFGIFVSYSRSESSLTTDITKILLASIGFSL